MKVTTVHYFDRTVDVAALAAYKKTAEYERAIKECGGDWAFSRYLDELEDMFTEFVPVLKHRGDIAIDYVSVSKYAITCYLRNSIDIPVMRFKFSHAKYGIGRRLTLDERRILETVIKLFDLKNITF